MADTERRRHPRLARRDSAVAAGFPDKPLLRGYLHAASAPAALLGAGILVYLGRQTPSKWVPFLIYGLSLFILLGGSALYHVFNWSPRAREVLRRLDHANIYLFIAGTYTPVAVNALSGWWRVSILGAVWAMAAIGIVVVLPGFRVRRQVEAALYILTGWVAVAALPALVHRFGLRAVLVLGLGGLIYTLGAVVYALRWPPLWRRVFGYHELFHVLVVVASVVFFLFMLLVVLPLGA